LQRRILVPLDGSSAADSVLAHVCALARGGETHITLLRVMEPAARAELIDDTREPSRFRTEKVDDARAHLARTQSRLQNEGLDAEVLLMRGVAIDSICQACTHVGANLLAMTARGRSSVRGALFGNVALGVLNRAPCPIFMAPPAATPRSVTGYGRILVPLDGSARAESVLPHVQALAVAHDAPLLLLRVVRTGYQTMALDDVDQTLEDTQGAKGLLSRLGRHQDVERLREAQAYLREQRAALKAQGLDVDAYVGHGRPTECILALADDADADLVALTNHLRSGLASVLYGSVASGLLGRLGRPMLIVPTGEPPARNFV
jgi:nucleotide-binding universal stress UspA family protein